MMTFEMMAQLFPIAAQLADIHGTPTECMQSIMTEKQSLLWQLIKSFAGDKAPKQPALETLTALRCGLRDGGMGFLHAVKVCGAELVCDTLYSYRPESPEALCYLLNRQQKKDFTLRYIADALRLLVLSKLKKGTQYPSLTECLRPEKYELTEQDGTTIFNTIINAALGGAKGE